MMVNGTKDGAIHVRRRDDRKVVMDDGMMVDGTKDGTMDGVM